MPVFFGGHGGYQFTYRFTRARFQFLVNGGSNQTMYWDERFTAYNPQLKYLAGPVEHDIQTWDSHGATESPIYTVDPLGRRGWTKRTLRGDPARRGVDPGLRPQPRHQR